MERFRIEGKGKPSETIKIDTTSRNVFLTYETFILICEVLNRYSTDTGKKPPKEKVRQVEATFVEAWHSQDRDFRPPQWPE